ncbi:choice-of-anchor C domain-containing protein [Streptoalloteichus hindustanus]|uniref:Choice-of-anchor C domain-containing protein n=2 Tax=Streptoalloteichus hindustanus TaxID=2017 RepID=A0A1M5I2W6_STRHI|nr:choice-of-anchor C domain-containing protein [Streptoalloteichus hindustanus]
MKLARFSVAAAVVAGIVLAGTASAATPTDTATKPAASPEALSHFDDGSFETPKVKAGTFQELTSGQSIGPWQVTSGSVDLIGAGFWQAAEGDQSVDLNGRGPGTVSQTFTTVPGTTYTVTYSLAGNTAGAPAVKTGKALIDGQNFQDFSFDITGKTSTTMGYVTRQFTFVATNPSTTLAFASTTPGTGHGPVIDDVKVRACQPCPHC